MADFEAEQAFLRSMQDDDAGALSSAPIAQPSHSPDNASASHQLSMQNPRTIGGFVLEDDDDEEGDNDDDDDDDDDDTNHNNSEGDGLANSSIEQHSGIAGLLNVDRGSSNTPQRSSAKSPSSHAFVSQHHDHHDDDDSIQKNSTTMEHSDALPNGSSHVVPNLAAVLPNTGATTEDSNNLNPSPTLPLPSQTQSVSPVQDSQASLPKGRLPHDVVGMLEDRIKEDPRGDIDAWLSLINEHRKRNKLDDARAVYDRFFKVFPSAAEQWDAYANMELENNDFFRVEAIFNRSLMTVPNVHLWSTYLNYVRRRNNLTTDVTGNARQVVSATYDFVLKQIGIDKDSGEIWQDYVQFIRSGPGQIGGNSWQDQQKMDLLRKTFQRAICVPNQAVNALWKEYESFEMGLNKMTGRKFLQERSPAYMTARSSHTALQNIIKDLKNTTLPTLPPVPGFEGDVAFAKQVEIWKKWIEWEKGDPLVLKDEDLAGYKARILYVYKQALMPMRFWPELWFEAVEFCFANDLEKEGNDLLSEAVIANPESPLLAFKRADQIESTTSSDDGDDSLKRRGDAVREPYDKVLDALYELITQVEQREAKTIMRIKENATRENASSPKGSQDEEDDEEHDRSIKEAEALQNTQIEAVKMGNEVQIKLLTRTISFVWIALMRAMRRIQGKGKPHDPIGGSRQIFTDARKRGRLTSDVYVASALIEYHCYKDPAATKIFERGMKLFPKDEQFALEYLKHLISTNDVTNARAVFETTVSRLAQKPDTLAKSKPIYAFFHEYEANYGELGQVKKLEKRMADLFPEDPSLQLFSQRYVASGFDPTVVRPIISLTQAIPKIIPTIEQPTSMRNSPQPPVLPQASATNSPKRQHDDSDNEGASRPTKLARSNSPLKGAAGRRLETQKRTQLRNEMNQASGHSAPPVPPPQPLPREIMFLLSIIPRADSYNATVFNPERMVNLLRGVDLSRAQLRSGQSSTPQIGTPQTQPFQLNQPQPQSQSMPPMNTPQTQYGYGQANTQYGYGR